MNIFDDVVPHTPAPKRDRERLRAEARAKADAGHKAHVRRQAKNLAPREEDLVSWDEHSRQVSITAPREEDSTSWQDHFYPGDETPGPAPTEPVFSSELSAPIFAPAVHDEPPLDFDDLFTMPRGLLEGESDKLDVETILGPPTPRPHFGLFLVAAVLGGLLGIDRFLGRRYVLGALKLLTLGGLGIWALWDIAAILGGTYMIKGSTTLAGSRKHRLIATGTVGVVLLLVGALLVPQVVVAASSLATQPVVEAPRSEKVLELRSMDPKLRTLDLPVTADLTLTAMVTSSGEGSLVVTAPDRTSSFHELADGQQTIDLEVHAGTWNLDIDCPSGCAVDVYSPPVATP